MPRYSRQSHPRLFPMDTVAKIRTIGGILIFAIGVALMGFSFHATQTPWNQTSSAYGYSDETVWFFITGSIIAVGGALLVIFARQD